MTTTNDVLIRKDPLSPFFASLADHAANSRKSQDWQIISGHHAMLVFAGALGLELVTEDSLFKNVDGKEIVKAAACRCSFGGGWMFCDGRIFSLPAKGPKPT